MSYHTCTGDALVPLVLAHVARLGRARLAGAVDALEAVRGRRRELLVARPEGPLVGAVGGRDARVRGVRVDEVGDLIAEEAVERVEGELAAREPAPPLG